MNEISSQNITRHFVHAYSWLGTRTFATNLTPVSHMIINSVSYNGNNLCRQSLSAMLLTATYKLG